MEKQDARMKGGPFTEGGGSSGSAERGKREGVLAIVLRKSKS